MGGSPAAQIEYHSSTTSSPAEYVVKSKPSATSLELTQEGVDAAAELSVDEGVADSGETFAGWRVDLTGVPECVKYPAEGDGPVLFPPRLMPGTLEDMREVPPEFYTTADPVMNVELGWLAFNWRVLAMAISPATPVFERLRFIAIAGRNLDEFMMKRVGGLKRQEAAGIDHLRRDRSIPLFTPDQQLEYIAEATKEMVDAQTACLVRDVLPCLRDRGVSLLSYPELTDAEKSGLRKIFLDQLEPMLTPLAIDPGHPFPYISNLTISLAVVLHDPMDGSSRLAILNVPSSMKRWVRLTAREGHAFVALEQIIAANLDCLFGGMIIESTHAFRVTRNADIDRHEEEADDLLEMITDEMRQRKFAPFVRIECEANMPQAIIDTLVEECNLLPRDVYTTHGPLAMGDIDGVDVDFGMDESLTFPQWTSLTGTRFKSAKKTTAGLFDEIRKGDVLAHHPYESFYTSTQRFVARAARDPQVAAIKATLYRTNNDSPIISALSTAAENGKQVAVLVELKARFDEARNVGFAQKLEAAGVNVAYGLVGLKTHCKATLVVRREEDAPGGLRTYCHLGTGNYNPSTAAIYTDLSLFTCDPALGKDVQDLFKYLTGYHRQDSYLKLLVAPQKMQRTFLKCIDREIANAKQGLPSGVVVKVNGLTSPAMVERLYEASQAGVKVDLIVRGTCILRPGVPGVSENIRVVSTIGRFLEHHRLFRFENAGQPQFYMGSADWMTRNLLRRVEVVTPVEDRVLQQELQLIMDSCLKDMKQTWEMRPDGRYELPQAQAAEMWEAGAGAGEGAQQEMCAHYRRRDKKYAKRQAKKAGMPRRWVQDRAPGGL